MNLVQSRLVCDREESIFWHKREWTTDPYQPPKVTVQDLDLHKNDPDKSVLRSRAYFWLEPRLNLWVGYGFYFLKLFLQEYKTTKQKKGSAPTLGSTTLVLNQMVRQTQINKLAGDTRQQIGLNQCTAIQIVIIKRYGAWRICINVDSWVGRGRWPGLPTGRPAGSPDILPGGFSYLCFIHISLCFIAVLRSRSSN